MNEQQAREDQIAYGRSQAQLEGATLRRVTPFPKKFSAKPVNAPKGHEAFLKALESSGAIVEFEKASTGEKVIGKIKTSDKYTVSLAVPVEPGSEQYVTRVLFKHDISEFSTISRTVETH